MHACKSIYGYCASYSLATGSADALQNARRNERSAANCAEFTYRRFRKLTLEVKLVLKLEKFSVPAFSCSQRQRQIGNAFSSCQFVKAARPFGSLTWGAQIRPHPTLAIALILTTWVVDGGGGRERRRTARCLVVSRTARVSYWLTADGSGKLSVREDGWWCDGCAIGKLATVATVGMMAVGGRCAGGNGQ